MLRVRLALLSVGLMACSHGKPATSDGATTDADTALPDAVIAPNVRCTGALAGAYCGLDDVSNGDPAVLYQCPGANLPPTSAVRCPRGCTVAPPGQADFCTPAPSSYRLPWSAATSMRLTQDCNDSCCADHVGSDKYSWDFANGGAFAVKAVRAGRISHLKINSTTGCGTSNCASKVNYLVIDHGDGSQAVYMHLAGNTLAAGLYCGDNVAQGQALATAGTTGWSTGVHLHFEVSPVHANAATCECGVDGTSCDPNTTNYSLFWNSAANPTAAITFEEWPQAAACNNRRMAMPASTN